MISCYKSLVYSCQMNIPDVFMVMGERKASVSGKC